MSKIEWTDATWNPVIGCSKTSPGCKNCYAERMAVRQCHMRPGCEYSDVVANGKWNGKTAFVESALTKPMYWRKPRKVFVCSMGDLFHSSVPFEWIDRVFAIMALCPQHTFQVLTKQPERMAAYTNSMKRPKGAHQIYMAGILWPLPNVWLGTSVENQETANERIPHLLRCPAAVRFVSAEPLLGPVDFNELGVRNVCNHEEAYTEWDTNALVCNECEKDEYIDWVIVGGESGPGARPMHPAWVRSIRDQCATAGVPFLFKQWGEWSPECLISRCGMKACASISRPQPGKGGVMFRCGKKAAGRKLDGVIHDEYPEVAK